MHLDMENLVKLQNLDSEITTLEKFVSVSPSDLLEKETKLEELHNSLSSLKTQLQDATEELTTVKNELESSQTLFEGAEVKKGNVHNSKEYEAALREIDSLSTTIANLTTRKNNLEKSVATFTEELSSFDNENETLQKEVDTARTSYEKSVSSSQSKLNKLLTQRDQLAPEIPKPILSKYTRLLKKFPLAVVPLEGEFCSGCSIQLTPQSVVEVRRGNTVTKCLNCGCYIYSTPDTSK